jgi:hypothetical protein
VVCGGQGLTVVVVGSGWECGECRNVHGVRGKVMGDGEK